MSNAITEHLVFTDSIELSTYDTLSNKDNVDYNKSFILALSAKRKAMSASQRARTNDINFRWKYPYVVEKRYSKYLRGQITLLSEYAFSLITPNIDRWVAAYKNATTVDNYEDEVEALIRLLEIEVERLRTGPFPDQEAVITYFGGEANSVNAEQWEAFATKAVGYPIPVDETWVKPTLNTWVKNNETLLSGLSNEYVKTVHTTILGGLSAGMTSDAIIRQLRKKSKNLSGPRANLIGRDQIGKLNGLLTQNRSEANGLSDYVWLTSIDERVRSEHRKMESKVCSWKRPTQMSHDGIKWFKRPLAMYNATPGSQIQCRCTSRPYFAGLLLEIDKNIGKDFETIRGI